LGATQCENHIIPAQKSHSLVSKMYYLYHIRKTGGRSIIHSFLALATNNPGTFYKQLAKQPPEHCLKKDGKIFIGWNTSTLKHRNFFFAFSHDSAHTLTLPYQIFTITCFRDPLARLKSYYNHLMEIKQDIKKNPNHVHANLPDLVWAHNNQMKFLKDVPRQHLLNQLFMFSKQMQPKEAADNISKVDFVLQTEKMTAGIKRLSRLTKIELQPQHTGITKTKCKFSDDFLAKAKHILEPEFDLMRRLTDRGLL